YFSGVKLVQQFLLDLTVSSLLVADIRSRRAKSEARFVASPAPQRRAANHSTPKSLIQDRLRLPRSAQTNRSMTVDPRPQLRVHHESVTIHTHPDQTRPVHWKLVAGTVEENRAQACRLQGLVWDEH